MAEIRYARNIWYLAAWENEIPEGGTLARTLLSEPVAIFRTSSGDCAILQDRCPHRFAPLRGGYDCLPLSRPGVRRGRRLCAGTVR
jgi:phenylpropionate dioxygenase-like ring-hydroxylating dioxygenase large terminal subunit